MLFSFENWNWAAVASVFCFFGQSNLSSRRFSIHCQKYFHFSFLSRDRIVSISSLYFWFQLIVWILTYRSSNKSVICNNIPFQLSTALTIIGLLQKKNWSWIFMAPQKCYNNSNMKFGVSALTWKRTGINPQDQSNLQITIVFYNGVCFLPFFILEDESLIVTWGSIISHNSFLKCKSSFDGGLVFKNWLWRWIWSSGGKFLQFLTLVVIFCCELLALSPALEIFKILFS